MQSLPSSELTAKVFNPKQKAPVHTGAFSFYVYSYDIRDVG